MRRSSVVCVLMITLLLSACGGAGEDNGPLEQALAIRGEYLAAAGCTARLDVTADYGQRVYTYTVDVTASDGCTALQVVAPEEVAGFTAYLDGAQGSLEYNGAVLETGELSSDGLTPLSAVPAMLETARSGFIADCTREMLGERETVRVQCHDPAAQPGNGRESTLWFDADSHVLLRGEISVDGRRAITCEFSEFALE